MLLWMRWAVFLGLLAPAGLPAQQEINPRDVYPLIVGIIDDVNDIRAIRNIQTPVVHIPLDRNKTPTDVYDQAYELLLRVHALTRKNGYAISAEYPLPERRPGRKVPADVLELFEFVQQELWAIKAVLGIDDQRSALLPQPGKTPPDVYQQVSRAIALVDTL